MSNDVHTMPDHLTRLNVECGNLIAKRNVNKILSSTVFGHILLKWSRQHILEQITRPRTQYKTNGD